MAQRFLDPRNDVAFKKIFGSEEHKGVTISFLNSILGYTGDKIIESISFLNTEQLSLVGAIDKKDNVLDILCIDQAKRRYIVEMQMGGSKEFDKRMVYYGAKTYALQLEYRKPYRDLQPVVAIAVINFIMFPNKAKYKSIHRFFDDESYEQDLGELTFVFVELEKFNKQEDELITIEDKWLYFIKEISRYQRIPQPLNDGELSEACHIAERMTWTEGDLNAYTDALVREADEQAKIDYALEQGMERGLEKGREEREKEMIFDMFNAGMDIKTISQITKLSEEKIKDFLSEK